MQDTKNLKKKLKEYRNNLRDALIMCDHYNVNYYNDQIEFTKSRIKSREKNKKKNDKMFKKAHGHFA